MVPTDPEEWDLERRMVFLKFAIHDFDWTDCSLKIARWRLRISSYRSADCWGVSRWSPRSSGMSRTGDMKDRKVRSTELSTRVWDMALKKPSAWTKGTVCPARTAA